MSEENYVEDLLTRIADGDQARSDLAEHVFDEFRKIASKQLRSERVGHTLQTTALANEAFAKLMTSNTFAKSASRRTFFAAAANATRRILVDYARRRNSAKRGSDPNRQPLDLILDRSVDEFQKNNGMDLVELDDALELLKRDRPRQHEAVVLRYFGGYTIEEVADLQSVSPRTVVADVKVAMNWLKVQLQSESP